MNLIKILSIFLLATLLPTKEITNLKPKYNTVNLKTDTVKKNRKPTPARHQWPKVGYSLPKDKIYFDDCVFINKYNTAQRLKKYPFLKAAKIVAVSHHGIPPNEDIIIDQPVKIKIRKDSGINIINDTLDYSVLVEYKQLTQKQINQLTYIIYNTDIKIHNNYVDPGVDCFNPHNGFVFFDKNGKAFDYIDICFECGNERSLSGKINTGSGCNQKYDMLRKFLIDAGIKYGTVVDKDKLYHRF